MSNPAAGTSVARLSVVEKRLPAVSIVFAMGPWAVYA